FLRWVIVNFDRDSGTVTIRTVGLLGQKQQSFFLTDVEHAFLETIVSQSTGSSRARNGRTDFFLHRPSLQTKQGVLPLNEVSVGGDQAAAAVAVINRWLERDLR
ncbi:MAG: hypothetical protein ACRCUE_09940, partial [Bosea sp. (in: a-proteobacteria)]